MAVELKKNGIEVGIVTEDPEALLKFYRDTLGFVFEMKWDVPGGNTMYRLKCGDCIIKIVQPKNPPPAKAPPGGIDAATGYRYWTIHISNMDSALEDVRNGGYTVVVPAMEIAPGVKIAIVEDPDGNWVEFVD